MLSWFLCILFTASSAVYNAFVTSTGNNNTYCSSTNPCGAIQFVFANIDNGYIIDEEIIITISGINPSYDSFCRADISGDITLIFDSRTIKTSDDWWCGLEVNQCVGVPGRIVCYYPITIQSDSSLKIYNMPLDSAGVFAGAYDGSNQRFYCENCIFNNDAIYAAKFVELTFVDCTFNGSSIGGIGGDVYNQQWYERDAKLNISHSNIINVNSDFVKIYANQNYKRNIYIDHVIMISTERFIYVYNAFSFSFITNEIDIRSSIFLQGADDDKMVVLYVDEATQIDISFEDVTMEYGQYLDQSQVVSGNYDEQIPIYIGSATAEMVINTLTVKTNVRCSIDDIGWTTGRRRNLLATGYSVPGNPWCNAPLSFLYNDGIAILNDIKLETDFIESYGAGSTFAISGNSNGWDGISYLPSDEYDFSLSNKEIDNLPYFSAIINGYDAVMEINNLYVAIGAYYGIIFNSGKAQIDNIYTEFAEDPSAYYDPWNLALVTAITNNIGSIEITNSKISGFGGTLIDIYGGDVRITNTILSQSTKAMKTYYTADSIYLDNVEMYEISIYYIRVPILSSTMEIEQIAVTHLSAHSITTNNSSFYIFDPFGTLHFDQKGLLSSIEYGVTNNLLVLNNQFIDPRVEFPGYKRLTDFSFLYSLTDIDSISIPKRDQNIIFVDNQYQMSFGKNLVHFSNQTFPAYVYFDTNTNGSCMASNSFYNVDLYIKSGNFSSCKHKEITIDLNSCLSNNLGVTDHTFTESHFVNSSLIINESFSVILDDAVFNNPSEKNPFYIAEGAPNQSHVLVMLDVIILNHEVIIPGYCDIVCNQFVDQQISFLRQFMLYCEYNPSLTQSNEAVILTNSSRSQSFSFWNPDAIILKNHDDNNVFAIFPGEAFQVDFNITDKYGNIVHPDYYPSNITINLINSNILLNSFLVIDSSGKCQTCETGIDLAGITIYNVRQQHIIQAQVANDILIANDIQITITDCPSGYGVSSDTLQCEQCLKGQYTIESNLGSCHVCPDDLYHVECLGSNILIVEYNYWMKAENASESSPILINSDCPNNYCCQLADGCDYLLDDDMLCALNRDPSTPLCGQCKDGYSELIGTTNCGRCDEDHYEFFIIPLMIAILFSIYLLCFDVPQRRKKQQETISASRATPVPPLKLSKSSEQITPKVIMMDDWRGLMVMLFKVLLYFAQGLSFVLLASPNINGGLMFYVLPILQVWSLGIDFGINSGADDAGFCLLEGMTALQEILLNLTIPAFMLFIISTVLILKWIACCKAVPKCKWIGKRQLSFTSAYLRGLLLTIGSVLASIFKILSCRKVGDKEVHFYYGSEECYDGLWFLSLCGVVIIFVVWTIFDILLFKMKEKRQKRRDNYLWTLISAYKPKYWWWETLLLSRRTFLALFTIISDSTGILNNTLTVLLCIYFGLQIWTQPFKYKRVNRLETISILVLIIVAVYNNNVSLIVKEGNFGLGVFLLACISLPGLIVLYEFVQVIKHLVCPSLDTLSPKHIQKIEMRRPTFSPLSVQIENVSDGELDDNDDNKEEEDDLVS